MSALAPTGRPIRCMARDPGQLESRLPPNAEAVAADVFDPPTLLAALADVDTAYYMIHSMGAGGDFDA